MDFIGSKVKLNDWIFGIIKAKVPYRSSMFMDGCSGSGVVSRYAAKEGYEVISNDLMQFPKVLANGSIGLTNAQKERVKKSIDALNRLGGNDGFFYQNFTNPAKYFTEANARRIDEVRMAIEVADNKKVKDCLLYCAIEALSRVSNTAGTHGAYLKKIKSRAKKPFTLRMEELTDGVVHAYSEDLFKILGNGLGEEILYIDPPYNSRQYGNNYHLYETFVRYDSPTLVGKTKLRDNWKDESGSEFCNKNNCMTFLKKVVEATSAKHIFVSYSSDGLLTKDDICTTFSATVEEKDQRRYKADADDNRIYSDKPLFEYLFHIQK